MSSIIDCFYVRKFNFNNVCVGGGMYKCPHRPIEGIRYPGATFSDSCEPCSVSADNYKLGPSPRAASTLNH